MRALAFALLLAAAPARAAQTIVTFGFDDNTAEHLQAGQILAERGMRATFYVNSARIGANAFYLTRAQLNALAAQGHEIAGHTLSHLDLTTLTEAEARRQICDDRAQLRSWGFAASSLAYPFGANDARARAIARDCGYTNARTVGSIGCSGCPAAETIPPSDAFQIRTPESVKDHHTLADLQRWVTRAESSGGGWVSIVLHRLCDGCVTLSISPSLLAQFADWLRTRPNVVVRTSGEVMGGGSPLPPPPPSSTAAATGALLAERFAYPNGLITNSFAFFNPTSPGAVHSATWSVNAGSLFAEAQAGWTGAPDNGTPNAQSSNANGSAVFNAFTKRSDFGNVSVYLTLTNHGFVTTPTTPAQPYDEARVELRRQANGSRYFFSVNRRDNTAVLKKQLGTAFTTLASTPYATPFNSPQQVQAHVQNVAGGVQLRLVVDGAQRLLFTDTGAGGAAITAAGAVGVYGKNAHLRFDDVFVMPFGVAPSTTGASPPTPAPAPSPDSGAAFLADGFTGPDALITNEYAFWNPADPSSVKSDTYTVTAGSLFRNGNTAWTGVPDLAAPNAGSTNGTGSARFRLLTKRGDFGDAEVSMTLVNQGFVTTAATPAQSYDGIRLVLRYLSESAFYELAFNRRDNSATIKKKAGSAWTTLASTPFPAPIGSSQQVGASVRNNTDGSVTLTMRLSSTQQLSVIDAGAGGAPLRTAGAIGVRGDNVNMRFDNLTVTAPGGAGTAQASAAVLTSASAHETEGPASIGQAASAVESVRIYPNPWRADRHGGSGVTIDMVPARSEIRLYTVSGQWIRTLQAPAGTATWDLNDASGSRVSSGIYLWLLTDDLGHRRSGTIAVLR